MQPKVSMVVPCYNTVEYIGEMLDSVIAQQWDNIELVLVNDGSTDGTREIIAEYKPKFKARGYEVVIIDQENMGLSAAIKNGLLRITGEFVCMPDSDDVLHPGYVSAMAGWLWAHTEDMLVACDCDRYTWNLEEHPCLKKACSRHSIEKYKYMFLESYLLFRIAPMVWVFMIRVKYLNRCHVLDAFATEPRVSQEFQTVIPLAIGRAEVTWIHKPLYKWRQRNESMINSLKNYLSIEVNLRQCMELISKTLTSHGHNNDKTESLAKIGSMQQRNFSLIKFDEYCEEKECIELAELVNASGLLDRRINQEEAEKSGFSALFRYFSNTVIGYDCAVPKIARKSGRIIAYSAYGIAAKRVYTGLVNSDIVPDEFWDIAAEEGDTIIGRPVYKPDLGSLTKNDIVIVLLQKIQIAAEVGEALASTAAKDNIWYYYDVLDYLADFYYGV